ncbi:MAG: HEAT repeat domain-containing protein [Bacteroidales bacterium]|jgi:HEAT repeat protein|nr:HEAT repeat domain-containing protein [Bacteroidales bacterium]
MIKSKLPTYSEIIALVGDYENVSNEVFLVALDSPDEYVVWYAIKACGLKRIESSIDKLFHFLGEKCNDLDGTNLRKISVWSLAKFDSKKIFSYVEKKYKSQNPMLREDIADLLGFIPSSKSLILLDELLGDKEDRVLLWASLSLSKKGNDAITIIKKHLKQENIFTKNIYLIDALSRIASREAIDVIKNYKQVTLSGNELQFINALKL